MSTFVLVHGVYQGGWIWKPVATRLRAQGHLVYAPSLDGCGERASQLRPGITTESQAEEIASLLWHEELSDVVLVGTSAGGMVVAKTAELARDRVERLVFVDALVLKNGERIRDIVTNPSPTRISNELALGRDREETLKNLLPTIEPDIAAGAADRFGMHPIGAYEPVVLESFWDQPWEATVIWCRQAQNPGEAHQRRCAEALGARWEELDTGHYPMLSAPDALARLIARE